MAKIAFRRASAVIMVSRSNALSVLADQGMTSDIT
jgi:hypothetical protein